MLLVYSEGCEGTLDGVWNLRDWQASHARKIGRCLERSVRVAHRLERSIRDTSPTDRHVARPGTLGSDRCTWMADTYPDR
jgi:hypothetical protein